MSFCGTIEHNRGARFLTLALHCIVLNDPLLAIEDARYEGREGRKRTSRKRRSEPVTEAGQLQMFPLTTEQRAEYAKLAKTMRYFLDSYREDVTKTKPKTGQRMFGEGGRLDGLEYCDYEFYDFWYGMIKRDEAKFEEQAEALAKLGEGVVPDDCKPTIDFLSSVNGWALHRHEDSRGGCF
jgi:hypothetical protein